MKFKIINKVSQSIQLYNLSQTRFKKKLHSNKKKLNIRYKIIGNFIIYLGTIKSQDKKYKNNCNKKVLKYLFKNHENFFFIT